METYTMLREFADSWFLIAMFGFFLAACGRAFLPSQRQARRDAANIPFREGADDGCSKDCAGCACNTDLLKEAQNG